MLSFPQGGMKSVVWTDVTQGSVFVMGIFFVIIAVSCL